jgi:hypothetical protein
MKTTKLLGLAAIAVAILLAAAEGATRLAIARTGLAATVVDIQTPETFCAKLDYIRRFDGRKMLVIGDSLAFGRAMADHGDRLWREHDLASAIRNAAGGSSPLLVANLGLNGGLPADQETILRALQDVRFDLIVATISIRSFASDFAAEIDGYSRQWLREIDPERCHEAVGGNWFDRAAHRVLSRMSSLYSFRDLIQRSVFDETPRDAVARFTAMLGGSADAAGGALADPGTLLLAKGRFSRITFETPHAQVDALGGIKELGGRMAGKMLFLYGPEAPRLLPSLISKSKYRAHRENLRRLIDPDGNVTYLDDLAISMERYLDYVHVDAEGYRQMAEAIVSRLEQP